MKVLILHCTLSLTALVFCAEFSLSNTLAPVASGETFVPTKPGDKTTTAHRVIASSVSGSRSHCAASCLKEKRCLRFRYEKTTSQCVLEEASYEPVSGAQNNCTYYSRKACSFTTERAEYNKFKFILKPLNVPFRLDFVVKTSDDARVVLAENTTHGSIFNSMIIGGWTNTRTVMRTCPYEECPDLVIHDEAGLIDANEYRPFWIDYQGGVVKVGKGGQEEAFLEWDAGEHHQRVPTQVRIGIASWKWADGDWVFYNFCE